MWAVLSVVAEPTESMKAGKITELSTPLSVTVTESVVTCSLEDDPHAVISADTASIKIAFFILVFVYFDY